MSFCFCGVESVVSHRLIMSFMGFTFLFLCSWLGDGQTQTKREREKERERKKCLRKTKCFIPSITILSTPYTPIITIQAPQLHTIKPISYAPDRELHDWSLLPESVDSTMRRFLNTFRNAYKGKQLPH